ncbi:MULTISPECIES: WXG100 family type VII secretion target [Streptomyces]|uniref:ESAT-6-like protein n=1 Tax=Streptomyces canarius TaxID=285453 RepID=A0ABQ3D4G9_9ACTN|nr:WXG100 family type VII secretion target [Streptomyces canarius]GHA55305.1 hypothetical protein GCM10010345_69940 [Streptomyces canarius]
MSPVRTVADDSAYQAAAQAIETTLDQCDKITAHAVSASETLISAWQGNAGNAFHQALQAWQQQYAQLRQMMDTFASTLAGTRSNMNSQENAALQNARRFHSMING